MRKRLVRSDNKISLYEGIMRKVGKAIKESLEDCDDCCDGECIGDSGASWANFRKEVASNDWIGTDASNEISIGEYGLLVNVPSVEGGSALCIYIDAYMNEYVKRNVDLDLCADLLHKEGVKSCIDTTDEEIDQCLTDAYDGDAYAAVRLVDGVISYYGSQEL